MSDQRVADGVNPQGWLDEWLIDHGLNTTERVVVAVKNPRLWDDLVARAEAHVASPLPVPMPDHSVLAGRSLDLTGFLACAHPDCLCHQVDRLFSHVWHYFDKIAVVGPDSHSFFDRLHHPDRGWATAPEYVASMAKVLMHIRSQGIQDLFTFVPKPPACPTHWPELSDLPALHLDDKVRRELILRLAKESKLRVNKNRNRLTYQLINPTFWNGQVSVRPAEMKNDGLKGWPIKQRVAFHVVKKYWVAAASDLHTGEQLGIPVGVGIPYETEILRSIRPVKASETEVAMQLDLPVVNGLPPSEVIKLRENEGDAFEAFRYALRTAMKARLSSSESPNATAIAQEIKHDVVLPALNDIRRRLTAADALLRRKHHVNIGIAGLGTVCGLMGSPTAALALTGAAIASGTAAEMRSYEEERDISLSDMYFLWKIEERQAHRNSHNRH